MLNWLFGKTLEKHLSETRRVRVKGIKFTIRKLNALNYIDGSKSLVQNYDTYKTKGASDIAPQDEKKIAEHFSHVLVGGVASPRLSHSDDGTGIHVDKLFNDWDLVVSLYSEIMTFTYGKKKNETTYLAKERVVEIDFLARRYGVIPSEFLELSANEFQFNLFVASHGTKEEARLAEKAHKRNRRGK